MEPKAGVRIFCCIAKAVHMEFDTTRVFEFADYRWECNACHGFHCSQCGYETDGETVTVHGCGRFDTGCTGGE